MPNLSVNQASTFNSRLFFALFMSVLVLLFASPVSGETGFKVRKTIVVGGDFYYPPYEYINEDGTPSGYNVDLTRAIAAAMGINVEIRLGKWSQMRKELENGSIDVISGMMYSEDRLKIYDFTSSQAIIHQSIFYRNGEVEPMGLEDLRNKRIIVQRSGSIHEKLLKMGFNDGLVLTDTHAAALRLLASGQNDYAVVANLPGQYFGEKFNLTNIVSADESVMNYKMCYAVKKGNPELLALMNEGLLILKNTGTQKALYEKWFAAYEPKPSSTTILKVTILVLVPLLIIIIGIIFWNRTLKVEVLKRTDELYAHQQQLIQADKMTSLGILVSGAAHEINNPNSLILLNTPIIEDAFKDILPVLESHSQVDDDFLIAGLAYSRIKDEIPLLISEMHTGAKKIKSIVDDLKSYARTGTSMDMELIDINQVVEASIRLTYNKIHKNTDHFHVSHGRFLEQVECNPQRVEQVIVNLLLNSCQALTSRSGSIHIKTYENKKKDAVVVEVKDRGCGMTPESLKHLTDPFFTTKRDSGGTGLGLFVSSKIVEEHKGTLSFKSKPGKGTTALLSLPIKKG